MVRRGAEQIQILIILAQRELNEKTRDYTVLKTQHEALLTQREQARIKGNLDRVSARSNLSRIGTVYAEPTVGLKKLLMMGVASCLLGGRFFLVPPVRYGGVSSITR